MYIEGVSEHPLHLHEMVEWIGMNKKVPYCFAKFTIIIKLLNSKDEQMKAHGDGMRKALESSKLYSISSIDCRHAVRGRSGM